ncbi:MAG: dihydrolipoamide acetyltransferase family protein [Anaerolineae bacterium]
MVKEFKLPDLGEGIHEAEVFAVNVKPGQQVHEDDVILEMETDKAAVEIPSPYSDVVTGVHVAPGDVVHVGDVLVTFGGTGNNVAQEAPAKTEAGVTPELHEPQKPVTTARPTGKPHHRRDHPVPAAPSTRRIARELGVDLHDVPPSGPGGRVTTEDVQAYAEGRRAPAKETKAPQEARRTLMGISTWEAAPPLPDFETFGPVERVPLRSVRRAIARQMALSWAQVPHVNSSDEADITALETLRRRYKAEVEAQGGKLTLTVFVIKALTHALKRFPKFNASLDVTSEEIVLKQYYNIGVAVDTERGLIVPVIRDADRKSAVELAVELTELAERTRAGEASLEDLQGGTMTITNIGALGSTGFAPIINYPEVAILGLAQARIRPVAQRKPLGPDKVYESITDGYEFVPRLMLPLILTFDHRVNDGAEAQRFLNVVIEQLEHPEKLLLGL